MMHVWVYRLINPTDGSSKLINIAKNVTDRCVAGALLFTGAHQTTPNGSFVNQGQNPGTTITADVTSAGDEIVVDCVAYWDDGDTIILTEGGSQTSLVNDSMVSSSEGVTVGISKETGANPTTMS
jgi:hypothetical protein